MRFIDSLLRYLAKPAPRRPEPFRSRRVIFVGEQDGPSECELKAQLAQVFAAQNVSRAYLARVEVDYKGSPAQSVALCLRAEADERLVQKVGEIFASMFGKDVHMDIMFVSELQEAELAKCCRPFFNGYNLDAHDGS